ncbi:MAG TPA: hypothetical protein PKY50_18855 [Candidatus Competibacter sp.]|nr:hypothetical protein [Candidatus Competibacter sp.]
MAGKLVIGWQTPVDDPQQDDTKSFGLDWVVCAVLKFNQNLANEWAAGPFFVSGGRNAPGSAEA